MKIFTIISILLIYASVSFAQIVINNTDMPQSGKNYVVSIADNFIANNFKSTGNNKTWNFTNLDYGSQRFDTFLSVTSTPSMYQFFFSGFTDPEKATVAKKGIGFDSLGGILLEDVYDYYRTTTSESKYLGFGATVSGLTLPMKYPKPDVVYSFPLQLGSSFNGISQLTTPSFVSSIIYYQMDQTRSTKVDGWGTIKTPFGTFQCIRVISVVDAIDSFYSDSMGINFTLPRPTSVEFKWLAKGMGLPVLQATAEISGSDTFVTSVEYLDSVRISYVEEFQNLIALSDFNLYPNPLSKNGMLRYNLNTYSNVEIAIFDITGQLIQPLFQGRMNKGVHFLPIDISELNLVTGVYVLKLEINGKNEIVKLLIE